MTTSDLLRAVAAHGLLGATLPMPAEPPTADVFDQLLAGAVRSRLTGLFAAAVVGGAFPLTDEQADRLGQAHFEAACSWLQLEGTTLEVVGVLAARGIDCRVLKGAATAHLDYPDPALRGFGDVDVLVRSDAVDAATAALASAGYRRQVPEPRPGFDRRFGKSITFDGPQDHEVDLHRTFVMGAFGLTIDLERLWQRRDEFEVAGRLLPALDPECRLLLACYNAVLGDRTAKLSTLRDIVQLSLRDDLDTGRVRELARAWRGEVVVATAVRLAWAALGVSDAVALSEWARRYQPDPWSARVLSTYTTADGGYAAKAWAALWTLPSMRDRASFLFSLAFPADGTLGGRRRSVLSRARSAARGWRSWESMS